ncbi:conserved hypothetical protein, membrane [Candidatus Magnetomorum sp. HK-1]|nr:conserved hypothetical protein, membrane [Candidatus Magnetomorum sp. HK-1]
MKRIVRILGFSGKEDTYLDIIAAIQGHFQPEKIEIIFVASEQNPDQPDKGFQQSQFVNKLHSKLSDIAKEHSAYKSCESIPLTAENIRRDEVNTILLGVLAVDVTAAPKDLAINLISNALRYGEPPVYYVKWLTKFERGKQNRIGTDPYVYEDLTKLDEARLLSRSYRSQSYLLLSLLLVVCIIAIIAGSSRWYPSLDIFNDILSIISIAAGFVGLMMAVFQSGLREGITRKNW